MFSVGVDVFGVSNWSRTFKNRPPWWEARWLAMTTEMGDLDDDAYWQSVSPAFHAEKIRRPLLVIQGTNDPRVRPVESDEIVATVRKSGVPVQYVVFDDEGHGILKKKNQITAYKAIGDFLDKHMGDK